MPLFKRLTAEEKQAKQQAKEEARLALIEEQEQLEKEQAKAELEAQEARKKIILENEILAKITNEKLRESIKNLDPELNPILDDPLQWQAILTLEDYLRYDFEETVIGYSNCKSNYGFDMTQAIIVCTNIRIIIIYPEFSSPLTFPYFDIINMNIKKSGESPEISFLLPGDVRKVAILPIEYANKFIETVQNTKDEFFIVNAEAVAKVRDKRNSVTPEPVVEKSVTEQLNELKQLLYSRTITQEQYDTMKAEITGE